MNSILKIFAVVIVAAGVAAVEASPAFAQRGDNTARDSLKSGKVMPYGEIKRRAERMFDGRVVGQNMARRGNRQVYNLKVLRKGGQVVSVVMDAQTGQVLSSKRGR